MKQPAIDLDGVIYNFKKRAEEILGRELVGNNDNSIWEVLIHHQYIYSELELLPDALELWEYLKPYNPFILTALPRTKTFPLAEKHKRESVARDLGPEVVVKVGPYARDKQNHCIPGALLIDDNAINGAQWSNKGGVFIFHIDTKTTIKALKEIGYNHAS